MISISVSILGFNKSGLTEKCLDALLKHKCGLNNVQYILTDNGSSDDTLSIMDRSLLPDKVIVSHPVNLGFSGGHNYALQVSGGEFFMALNNDICINDPLWVNRIVNAFSNINVALVGVTGVPCELKPNGNGIKSGIVDYLDGSILVGRANLLKKFGLFSSAFKLCFFEDSDVSLRYRQMGYQLNRISISHTHMRSSTVGSLDSELRQGVVKENRRIFLCRWGEYLKTKQKFTNKVLIKVPSVGMGDIIASLPTIDSICLDHPTALIDVCTKHPEVFQNKTNIHRVTSNKVDERGYDRVVNLDPNYGDSVLLHTSYAKCGATVPESLFPKLVLSGDEYIYGKRVLSKFKREFENVLVCNPYNARPGWAGRNWNKENFTELVDRIKNQYGDTIGIALVGNKIYKDIPVDLNLVDKTTIRQLFSIMFYADMFFGIDSMPFHVAQAFGIQSLVLFGATAPSSRVVDSSIVQSVVNPDMECVGCYQRKGKPEFNICEKKDDSCVRSISPDYVFSVFKEWFNSQCKKQA